MTTTNALVSEFPSGDGDAGGWFNFVMTLMPGDADLNGIIDQDDLDLALNSFYEMFNQQFTDGDFNGDGGVTGVDLGNLLNHWDWNLQSLWMLADFDGDFDVDAADIDVIADNGNMTGATWADGDLNGDGMVDMADLDLAYAQYGIALAVVS